MNAPAQALFERNQLNKVCSVTALLWNATTVNFRTTCQDTVVNSGRAQEDPMFSVL